MTRRILLVGAFLAGMPDEGRAQPAWTPTRCAADTLAIARGPVATTTTVDTVAPGITYRCRIDARGPWVLHVVQVDLGTRGLALDAERALGIFRGRETVSAAARRLEARGESPLVGINADFFDLATGEVENNTIVRGEWVKGTLRTDSPHDEFDNPHAQFAVDAAGRATIGRFTLAGVVRSGARSRPLVGLNYRPSTTAGLVFYTPWFGARTPGDTSANVGERPRDPDAVLPGERERPPTRSVPELRADSARRLVAQAIREAVEVPLTLIGRRGDTLRYRIASRAGPAVGGATPIPAGGAVLSATGEEAIAFLREAAARREVVKVAHRLDGGPLHPRTALGGWPRVVLHGENIAARADSIEGTFPRFSAARHPRSALGLGADGRTLWLVVVDGRRPWSVGMSLVELGDAMRELGATEAMNLDGGGSSTLWVRGVVVNVPSDPTGERPVGDALFVRRVVTRPR